MKISCHDCSAPRDPTHNFCPRCGRQLRSLQILRTAMPFYAVFGRTARGVSQLSSEFSILSTLLFWMDRTENSSTLRAEPAASLHIGLAQLAYEQDGRSTNGPRLVVLQWSRIAFSPQRGWEMDPQSTSTCRLIEIDVPD